MGKDTESENQVLYCKHCPAGVEVKSFEVQDYSILASKGTVKRNSEFWHHVRCEIFDSTTWAWKRLKDVILPCKTFFANKEDSVVAANGGLHWLLSDNQVFAFYEDEENREMFSLPPSAVDNGGHKSKPLLAEYQGRLAVIRSGEEFMGMWVMEHYGRKLSFCGEEIYPSPLAFHNGDAALFMAAFDKVMFYNFQEGKSRKVRLQYHPHQIFKFQSDMEEVNLERPDRVLKLQANSEEVNMENHPEDIRGLTKFLLPLKGFKPYLFLLLAPILHLNCYEPSITWDLILQADCDLAIAMMGLF
ncbi:hypothetical protein ACLB2K_003086 [Fragaria x ananassa]